MMFCNIKRMKFHDVRLLALTIVCLTIKISYIEGRKCVCTSKACLDAGRDTCRTRYSCYTELILVDAGQSNSTTRGCTVSATPLLCESLPRSSLQTDAASSSHVQLHWPRLRCCDSHDYCNGVSPNFWEHSRTSQTLSQEPVTIPDDLGKPSDPPDRDSDRDRLDYSTPSAANNGLNSLAPEEVRPMHVAVIVLAVAALISVLAAAYVITRFLRTHPYPISGYN